MTGKRKQQNQPKLTKQQIAQQMAQMAKAANQRAFVREKLYPILLKHKLSIKKAQQVCGILSQIMNALMSQYWAQKTVADLKLDEELTSDPEAENRAAYAELIAIFHDEKIADAQQLIQGMSGALSGYTTDVLSDTKLPKVEAIVPNEA